ncbi:ATP-dependent dethiobiotin synthetase BioD [Candidatus Nitrotoga sp. HW29]|uniref:dethiobiotin synthase n=1 Tax=Candidatus Nitrotoga sp. HW29 TaxID=2886963 RepID=UPI001EF1CACD|nr:dethiobiotin synthase [Candidatus Nitrotoga sp. HW29]CAH1903613.1 ATP-dependent dethiobiotin synthetase BioD [Candidatus Nitrotoga sp. HW29]
MSYFITGTDTGVGKTLISCALLHAFVAQGQRVVGMKPVAVGCDDNGHNQDVKQLQAASNVLVSYGQINPYSFQDPIAPHIAAWNAGVCIDFARILTSYHELAAQADVVIVEGAGGFRVPLNNNQDIADLALQLGLPVILVVGMRLGCLNHALLTTSAIEACGLKCAGWVANVLDADMLALQANIAALQQRLVAPLLGVVPWQMQPDARMVALQLKLELLEEI